MMKYCLSVLLYIFSCGLLIAQINVSSVQYCGPGRYTFTSSDPGCSNFEWFTVGGSKVGTGCSYTSDTTAFDQVMTVSNGTTSREINAFDNCSANACNTTGFPLVNIDFGHGVANKAPALNASLTTYVFEDGTGSGTNADLSVNDGEYTIINGGTGALQGGWHNITEDHTVGDIGGYMMVVNADLRAGEFYRTKVEGLCEGGIYVFSAWVMNVLSPTSVCGTGVPIDVRFVIEDKFGNVLGATKTGNIPGTSNPQWINYEFPFFIGTGQSELSLVLINAAPGGCGNDIILDDITFAPCGGGLSVEPIPNAVCEDAPQIQLIGKHNLQVSNPPLQWQRSIDGGTTWVDISWGANLLLDTPDFDEGDKFRLTTTLNGLTTCEAVSNEITVHTKECICPGEVSVNGSADLCNSSSSTKLSIGYTPGADFEFDILRNGVYYGTYVVDSVDATFDVDVNLTGTYTISNVKAGCPADSFTISGQGIVNYATLNIPDDTIYTCPNVAQSINVAVPSGASRIDWYDTPNGNLIQTGTNYTNSYLPTEFPAEIYPTAIFGSNYDFSNLGGSQYTWSNFATKKNMPFTALVDLKIESFQVDVNRIISGSCRSGSGAYTFELFQNGVSTGQTYSFNSTCQGNAGTPSFETVPVNFNVSAGSGYEIRANGSDFFMVYNLGNSWPKGVTDIITFPGGGNAASGAFFNWKIEQFSECDVAKISILQDPDCCKGFVVNDFQVSEQVVCSGDTVTLSTADFGPVFQWKITGSGATVLGALNTNSIDVILSGSDVTIDLTMKSADSCQNDTSVFIQVNPIPGKPGVADLTYCQDAPAVALTATGSNLKWYTDSGVLLSAAPVPTTISSGVQTYGVSQENALGCEGPKALIGVEVFATPGLPIAIDTGYCKQNGAIQFSAVGSGLLWYNTAVGGSGVAVAPTVDLNNVVTTMVYVSQTENNCEGPRVPVEITVNPLPSALINGAVGPLCPQKVEVYQASSVGNTYSWSVVSGAIENEVAVNENYTLTFSNVDTRIKLVEENIFSCKDSTTIDVTLLNINLPNILPDQGICIGDTNEYSVIDRGGSMTWSLHNGNGTLLSPVNSDRVRIKANNEGKVNLIIEEVIRTCIVTDTLEIEIYELPTLAFSLPNSVCSNGEVVTLSGFPIGGSFNVDGVISTTVTPSVLVDRVTTKQVMYHYIDINGCSNLIEKSIDIIREPLVSIDILVNEICLGDATTISVNIDTTAGAYTLSWFKNGQHISTPTLLNSSGEYEVKASYLGCSSTSNKERLDVVEIYVDAGGDYMIDEGQSVNIKAEIILRPPNQTVTSVLWYDMDDNSILSNQKSFTYTPLEKEKYLLVRVENDIGCTDIDSALVKVRGLIHVPEIITPNGDGLNDFWIIDNIGDYPKSTTKVYNRWGNIVFEKTGYLNDWDGTVNGQQLPVATYYYVIELYDGIEDKPYTGSLTIIR